MVQSIIKPLRPLLTKHWRGPFDPALAALRSYPAEIWYYTDQMMTLSVISAVEVAVDKDNVDRGPEYHISVARQSSAGPQRCDSLTAQWMLQQFGLEGAEKDNHVNGGVVRNFWRTVAEPLIGFECGCKADEPRMIEDGGDFIIRP